MDRFVDEALIEISSGRGGAGAVHFRKEKFVPKGGPDGGDGGDGGDVIFVIKNNLKTLSRLKMKRIFRAEDGKPGADRRKHGRRGRDMVIPVPPGTLVKERESGRIIKDLANLDSWACLKGGKGGRGNWHFKSSQRQAPHFAQSGEAGRSLQIRLELNLIADVGLVGMPNAGKSTLLSVLTNAHPRVGSYAFTTRIPQLGVMPYYDRDIILADIPGIIEGASRGAGLGLKFLRHINRTRVLAFLIDLGEADVLQIYRVLNEELGNFSPALVSKPRLIVGTKLDLEDAQKGLELLCRDCADFPVVGISAHLGMGMEKLKKLLGQLATEGSCD